MLQASIAATMGAAGGAPPYNSSRALAELNIMVQNPSTQVSAGVQLACYGPFYPPSNAKSLFQMLPVVDMNIVHHMIMFGGTAYSPFREPRANSDLCYRGSIVYAWARTGQKVPIGLNFDSSGSFGDAYAVGEGTAIKWFALQIHYQQLTGRSSMVDNSGVKLWFREQPPTRPLEVELMLSAQIRIPPRVYFDECVTCRVQRGGTAIAYRNHAHRLARDIYSEHFDVDGSPLPQARPASSPEDCRAWHPHPNAPNQRSARVCARSPDGPAVLPSAPERRSLRCARAVWAQVGSGVANLPDARQAGGDPPGADLPPPL